jgi:hypothetical protein
LQRLGASDSKPRNGIELAREPLYCSRFIQIESEIAAAGFQRQQLERLTRHGVITLLEHKKGGACRTELAGDAGASSASSMASPIKITACTAAFSVFSQMLISRVFGHHVEA